MPFRGGCVRGVMNTVGGGTEIPQDECFVYESAGGHAAMGDEKNSERGCWAMAVCPERRKVIKLLQSQLRINCIPRSGRYCAKINSLYHIEEGKRRFDLIIVSYQVVI